MRRQRWREERVCGGGGGPSGDTRGGSKKQIEQVGDLMGTRDLMLIASVLS